jgi:antitoxin component of MazEF toxin-antitoxin module
MWGSGACQFTPLNIPREIAKELGIHERQKLTVRKSGLRIIIEDWKEQKKLIIILFIF